MSILWIIVEMDRNFTSSELLINPGPDSPQVSGTSRSLSVYTRMSKAPTASKVMCNVQLLCIVLHTFILFDVDIMIIPVHVLVLM